MDSTTKEVEEAVKNMGLESADTNSIDSSESDAKRLADPTSNSSCSAPKKLQTATTSNPNITHNSNKPHPGQCFIFNQVEFDDKEKLPTRMGSVKDVESLRETFERFKLEVFEYRNPTLEEITQQIQKIKDTDYSAHSCLVIVILSHGDRKGKIYAKNKGFCLEDDIVFPILMNSTLKGKPKLFFIQTFQGNRESDLNHGNSNGQVGKGGSGGSYGNILKCYSTFEGYKTNDPDSGTYFIQTLCENLKEKGVSEPVYSIMKQIIKDVAERSDNEKIPSITSTMLMDFKFGDAI